MFGQIQLIGIGDGKLEAVQQAAAAGTAAKPEIIAEELDWPYQTVHEAIVDGWQIVQFPHLQAPFDDRDLDVVGYEFILQKMEIVRDE